MRLFIAIGCALAALVALNACGGKVVVDAAGLGGGGGAQTSSSVSTGTVSTGTVSTGTVSTGTVSTGPGGCTDHADCPGGLCLFGSNTCAPSCGAEFCASCGPGMVCNSCATSSCPGCADCLAACQPRLEGQCDDDDPCSGGQVCLFEGHFCAQSCQTDMDCDGFSFCSECASSSCCGCENCLAACIGGE